MKNFFAPQFNLPAQVWQSVIKAAILLILALLLEMPIPVFGAFGLSETRGYYIVDTGAGLTFKVRQSNGDITSLNFNGIEYQEPTKGSHINSGLGTANVTATVYGTDYIKIAVVDTTQMLTHYYITRNGFNHIYMATYFTQEPSIGLARFIVRIPSSLLPIGPTPSDIRGNIGAIEAADIFGMPNGTTRSKHYSNQRLLDWLYTGATGANVGIFMIRSNHEGDSGGPFYRSLINQCGGDQEIYEIINYGEAQTEPFRTSVLNGPYILAFTDGSPPDTKIDTAWLGALNLIGWVPDTDRGNVSGTARGISIGSQGLFRQWRRKFRRTRTTGGIPIGFQGVVGFANPHAQYWATVSDSDGSYMTPLMIPGTYDVTLYKGELAVARDSVTVYSGLTTPLDIVSGEIAPGYIFKIGEWDGTPDGMMNADRMTWMHPSDIRMNPWRPATFNVQTDPVSSFPSAQWKDTAVNNPTTILFNLTADQIAEHTLRVGITTGYAGGRPQISVNGMWTSSIPSPPSQPKSRTLTVGTYRGNNTEFKYAIPVSAFIEGQNTLRINIVSGSGGTGFLSPSIGYDAVELDY